MMENEKEQESGDWENGCVRNSYLFEPYVPGTILHTSHMLFDLILMIYP